MRKTQTGIDEIFVSEPLTVGRLRLFFEEQESKDFILTKSSLGSNVRYSDLMLLAKRYGYTVEHYFGCGQQAYRFKAKTR